MIDNGEECPKCHKMQMPPRRGDIKITGRMCQNLDCKYIQEFDKEGRVVFDSKLPVRSRVKET